MNKKEVNCADIENIEILLGLEVHITLNSSEKIFNREIVYEGDLLPNSIVGPWELGYLGTLPVLNPEIFKLALKLALSLNMKVSELVFFARKMYNYPDLSKGFQIGQHQYPLAVNGKLPIIINDNLENVPIKSVHLEEDTAKIVYGSENVKLDFNRAGNPLLELVTKPHFTNINTVLAFIKQLQSLLLYLNVSQAKMEKGQLRTDVNYSLKIGQNYSTPRYEIKNINSLVNIEKSLKFEIDKHKKNFLKGQKPFVSQTLGFDESKQCTIEHRKKVCYYYLPESNIPLIKIKKQEINQVKKKILDLPWLWWKKAKQKKLKSADILIDKPFLVRTINFLVNIKKKMSLEEEGDRWIAFYLNYLNFINREDIFSKLFIVNWKLCLRLFWAWKEKKMENREIKDIIHKFSLDDKTINEHLLSSLIKKNNKKKIFTSDEQQILENYLIELWNESLSEQLSTNPQKVRNYLLGKLKAKNYQGSMCIILSVVEKFLEEKLRPMNYI